MRPLTSGRSGERIHSLLGYDVFVIDEPAAVEEAEPVLVLHGFPTSSYDWQHALDVLRARRRVVMLDYPGYGLSAKPDIAYSLFAQADVVEACARELGLGDVVLVTHDVGDSIGGELLARELDGALAFHVTRRVLTNGSIYMDLVQLSAGQLGLLALPDAALPPESRLTADGIAAGLHATFAAGIRCRCRGVGRDGGSGDARRRRSRPAAHSSATSRNAACTNAVGRERSSRIRLRCT